MKLSIPNLQALDSIRHNLRSGHEGPKVDASATSMQHDRKSATMTMLVTHIGAAAGSLTWMFCEWIRFGKPSVLGIVTGMVAGLGTITPASGFVGPLGALVIGVTAGLVCFAATNYTMELDADAIGNAGYTVLKSLTEVQTDTCLIMVTRSGSRILQPCTVALNEAVKLQDGQVNQVTCSFNGNNRLTRYAS